MAKSLADGGDGRLVLPDCADEMSRKNPLNFAVEFVIVAISPSS